MTTVRAADIPPDELHLLPTSNLPQQILNDRSVETELSGPTGHNRCGPIKETNAMKCPVCETDLKPAHREGIRITRCPRCDGLWVGEGDLENIIRRSNPIDWDWNRQSHDNHQIRKRRKAYRYQEHYRS